MATATKWVLDPMHSEVTFKIKHLVISTVTGFFKKFEGTFEAPTDSFEHAEIDFSLDVDSIDTNQEQRDVHLKSADFFDAATYPKITFKSTAFTKVNDEEFNLAGNLTIKDVTKPVTLKVELGGTANDAWGNLKSGFEVTGKISRKEFGLVYDGVTEAGSVILGDEVKLSINAQFSKQA